MTEPRGNTARSLAAIFGQLILSGILIAAIGFWLFVSHWSVSGTNTTLAVVGLLVFGAGVLILVPSVVSALVLLVDLSRRRTGR